MEKQLTVTKPEGKVAIDMDGNCFTYEFVIKCGTRLVPATHAHVTKEIELDSYGVIVKVSQVIGESLTPVINADFAHLSNRTAEVASLVNTISRMDTLPPFDELSNLFKALRKQQEPAFKKDAEKALKRQLGVLGYSPFKRQELESKGLIPAKGDEIL